MKIYLVGGAVRDELLGLPVRRARLGGRRRAPGGAAWRAGYKPVGKDFPVFLHPQTGEEYALARTERKTGPGYRGFETLFAPDVTLEQDLERRDLTINAIAKDPDSGALIDPFGGQRDLRERVAAARLARRSSKIRCACCASRASPRASRRSASASRPKRWR